MAERARRRPPRDIPERSVDAVFEISWEVCNKVGGIYTVITSKAARMVERYGNGYFLVGPARGHAAQEGFRPERPPAWLTPLLAGFEARGVGVEYGRWHSIAGAPQTLLIDASRFRETPANIKARLWEWYRINSLSAGADYDEPLRWAWAAGEALLGIERAGAWAHPVLHVHEWLAGGVLLLARREGSRAGLVFTTHATVLGRALAARGVDIYRDRARINPDRAASECGVPAKHELERATAISAHVFTTVSAMTAEEAASFLGRAPDLLLPNGLDIVAFPRITRAHRLHDLEKRHLFDFVNYYFHPYYPIPLHETLFYFIASRYEFHDKGIDILIRALGRLNEQLKERRTKRTVVAFFWIPAAVTAIRGDLRDLRDRYFALLEIFAREGIDLRNERNLFRFLRASKDRDLQRLGFASLKALREFRRSGTPPLSTHELAAPDPIIDGLRGAGLLNREEDRVKAVFYPVYLSPEDGLLNLGYHRSMQAAHLGVFPSFYEPWGYTPLESAALGVPAVTTDLSGFGRYVRDALPRGGDGLYILPRAGKTDGEAASALADILARFALLTHGGRRRAAGRARHTAELADWKYFARHYFAAHERAREAAGGVIRAS